MPVCIHVCMGMCVCVYMCVSVECSWKLTHLQEDELDGEGPEQERDLLFAVGSFAVF